MATRRSVVKVVVAVAGVALLGLVFASTLRDVAAEPYSVGGDDLRRWSVVLSQRPDPGGALLSLRPPAALPMGLFDQVFQRTMESFVTPAEPGIPLVLQDEFDRSLAGAVSADELAALARESGLEAAVLDPECMAVHRTASRREQQQFFVLFSLPELTRFRDAVAELARARGRSGDPFDPRRVSAALLVASSDVRQLRSIPSGADLERSCEAPVILE